MILYHGSQTGGISILEPRLADHGKPYVYLSTIEVVAAFYLCNGVQRPYYWFPYGYSKNGIPYYDEMYPNALREVSEGVHGYIYQVQAKESQLFPFHGNPHAKLAAAPIQVSGCMEIANAYEKMLEYQREGKLIIARFEDKPEYIRQHDYQMILAFIRKKEMWKKPDCSYARFVKEKFPWIWEAYTESRNG